MRITPKSVTLKNGIIATLRSPHPEEAAEYGRVKMEGAELYPEDIDGYIAHKSGFIAQL